MSRDFPNIRLPLRIRPTDESFIVEDATGRLLLAMYYDEGGEVWRRIRN